MSALPFIVLFIVVADGPRTLSIEEALALAEQRSNAVAIARAGVRRADAASQRAWSEWYPQANASLGYARTLQSEYDDLLASTPSTGGFSFEDLPFGRKNNWRAGLVVTQNLFAGGRSVAGVGLAAANRSIAEIGVEASAAQALLGAVEAYYDTVLADQLVQIAEQSLRQAELTLEQTRLGTTNGTMPDFDLLRAQVSYENLRPIFLQRKDELEAAQLALKNALDLPYDEAFTLTSSLEGEPADITPAVRSAAHLTDDAERAPVRQARAAVSVSEAAERIAWSQHWPSLDVSFNYSPVAYPADLFPWAGGSDFGDVRYNTSVGLELKLPLFTGYRITADVEAARADIAEATARLRDVEEASKLDTRATENQLLTAAASYRASNGVVEQARRAADIAQVRYTEGISTQLELRDAQRQLAQAEATRARAARDLQVSRARLALLPSLPPAPAGAPR